MSIENNEKLTPFDRMRLWLLMGFILCSFITGLLAISCEVENNQLKHQQEMLRIQLQFATTNITRGQILVEHGRITNGSTVTRIITNVYPYGIRQGTNVPIDWGNP